MSCIACISGTPPVSPGRTFCTSLTLSPHTVKPKPSWSFCTTTHLWTRPGPRGGESFYCKNPWGGISNESTYQRHLLQLPVLSMGMSAAGSLCWVAEDLRSESPMVRLLSLVKTDDRQVCHGYEARGFKEMFHWDSGKERCWGKKGI